MLLLRVWFPTGHSREFRRPTFSQKTNAIRIFTGDVVEGAVWLVTGESEELFAEDGTNMLSRH